MKEHFITLFEYNQWANDLFSASLVENKPEHEQISKFFAHITAAQLIWLHRIQPLEVKVPGVWESMPIEEAAQKLNLGNELLLNLVASCDNFDRDVEYSNSKGVGFKSRLKHILTHVANHGTHHRAQIALLLREQGIVPPASDFIFYLRTLE